MEPGTWGEWASAIASTAAVAVALGLAGASTRRERAASRRRQAEQVGVWYEESWEPRKYADKGATAVIVHNGSTLPITNVRFPRYSFDDEGEEYLSATLHGSIEPGKTVPIEDDMYARQLGPHPYSVEFVDAAGQKWRKFIDGQLVDSSEQARARRGFKSWTIARRSTGKSPR